MEKAFQGRREDQRLVTGKGVYAADRYLDGETHGCFLRSDRAHAEILSIDLEAALAAPGVLAILTGKDTKAAGFGSPSPLAAYPGRGGVKIKAPRRQVLAEDRVRYVGQEVAFVVAETREQALEAAELIVVDYRDLPAMVDAEAAMSPDAVRLYPDFESNLCFDYEYGNEAAAEAAMAAAAHVTRLTLDVPRLVANPMEPKSGTVCYDPASGTYDLYVPTQGMTLMRESLSSGTGVPETAIRVHAQDVGGGFGVRTEGYSEYCTLMLAARTVGRPVKWSGTRSETFVSDHHGRAAKLFGELALDEAGNFTGLRVRWIVHGGGYLSQAGPLINTLPPGSHAVNLYRIPTVYGRHQLVLTNTTPTTAYRGAGRPNVSYLIERLVEEAARETGRDRVELRRRNLIPKEAFPHKIATGAEYDSGDPEGLLDIALAQSKWNEFSDRRARSRDAGMLRGIACSLFVEPSGGGRTPLEEGAIKFGESGSPRIFSTSGPSGQGHETAYPEIVARVFGVDPLTIENRSSDPDGPLLKGDGTIGSRSTMSQGNALFVAARELVKKGKDLAARHLEADAHDIDFLDGEYAVRGTDVSVALYELARRYPGELDTVAGMPSHRTFPSGAHVAEVEIDPETGIVTVVDYVAVDDCGVALNHTLVDGQVHGGIMQGLGQVLGEACLYDAESGQLMTGSFMDYVMPRADALSSLRLFDHSTPSPNNPLGVKGVGEAGTTGAVPTIANAVIDALRPLGIHALDLPYSPVRVWNAIEGHKRKG
ncbi:MAG: aerobic-type carbon monoxide dehydrogenase, large subunit CoxL/CutL-like protein [Hyphomicrobiales bacterium]|nr:aerobic-type carbon monoxide dehydrogenase, large subunit CoxL/CutL-like protein [Hyphomicrobiales bacterium]